MKDNIQKTILDFKNNPNFLYGNFFQLSDRNIRLDCLSFVISVYETIGLQKDIPRFSYTEEKLKEYVSDNFSNSEIGDCILFFVKNRNKKRNSFRNFHHLALKYSETEIAYLYKTGEPISIVEFEKYKFKKNLLTMNILEKGKLKELL